MKDQILCISYFDQIIGPNIFYCNESLDEFDQPDLGRILEFIEEEGTFMFAFRKYQTINHLFHIRSQLSRGGKEQIMITFIVRSAFFKNEIKDVFKFLDSKTPVLEEFASDLQSLEEFPIILHTRKDKLRGNEILEMGSDDFIGKFLSLVDEYRQKLNPTYEFEKPIRLKDAKKIFIVGDLGVGKTTFLKNLEDSQFYNQKNPDLPTKIFEIVIDNIEILTYDCFIQDFECENCKNYRSCLDNAQGFIFLFNASEKEQKSYLKLKDKFKRILNDRKKTINENTPILIIGNKFDDIEEILPNSVYKSFKFAELKNRGLKIKYCPINLLNDGKSLIKALKWLVKKML